MAKFVLITWAEFFFCVKPVSTSAKPACMKMTSTAPMHHPQQVGGLAESDDGVDLLGEGRAGHQQGGDGSADQPAERVLERGAFAHRFLQRGREWDRGTHHGAVTSKPNGMEAAFPGRRLNVSAVWRSCA